MKKDDKDSIWCDHCQNHDTQEMVVGKFMGDQQIYTKTLNEVVARMMVVEDEVGTQD